MRLREKPPQIPRDFQQTTHTGFQQDRLIVKAPLFNFAAAPLDAVFEQERVEVSVRHDLGELVELEAPKQFGHLRAAKGAPALRAHLREEPRFVYVQLPDVFRVDAASLVQFQRAEVVELSRELVQETHQGFVSGKL